MVEFDRTFNPLRDEILHENCAIEDGAIAIPSGPGLGISVDEEALERFVVRRDETATAS
jgi:D-galactarolactone cycloisomerase